MKDLQKISCAIMCFALVLGQTALSGENASGQGQPENAPAKVKVSKTPRIRTGVITNALFTTEKPASEGNSPLEKSSSEAWAVLTLSLDAKRALSVFDYCLRKDGTEYKCLDIAEGAEGAFQGTVRNYRSPESGKICRMVFAIPSAKDEYEIIFKLLPNEEDPVKLNVKEPDPPPAEENAVTLQNAAKLTGAERTPHKDLSPAAVALKHCTALALLEFDAYKETLSDEKAAQYKAPEVKDAEKQAKEKAVQEDHKYEVVNPDIKEEEASLTIQVTAGENRKAYSLKLKKTEKGWIVEEMTEAKAEENPAGSQDK